ncbi:MAG TPA: zeta toxin family protein [Candidatus Saccharimonadales bacterium]|nr:zeta toxin family protein [Candidatus Saccharimonadales bacterium]
MDKPIIVFITGLSGAGKSTLVNYFNDHPISNWVVYDYDYGKHSPPEDITQHDEWREKQTKWFFDQALENSKHDKNTLIIGRSMMPDKTFKLAKDYGWDEGNIHFGLLYCGPDERKKRIFDRGTAHNWRGHLPEYDEFHSEIRKYTEFEVDTQQTNLEDTVKKVVNWIMLLEISPDHNLAKVRR